MGVLVQISDVKSRVACGLRVQARRIVLGAVGIKLVHQLEKNTYLMCNSCPVPTSTHRPGTPESV